jgi:sugar phosphate isomerase/epimerase
MARTGLWWGTIESLGIIELIDVASTAGFSDISVTPAMYFTARGEGLSDADLRARLDDRGITVGVLDPMMRGLPGAMTPEEVGPRFRSTFEHGEDDCYRAADALGTRVINVAHYLGKPTPLDALADAIGGISARAAARGFEILVEFMPEGSITDLAAATTILQKVNAANCGLTFDTWHFFRNGGSPDQLRSLPPRAIRAVQVSDAEDDMFGTGVTPPRRDRLMPGEGVIPLRELVLLAKQNDPDAVIGLEVFNQRTTQSPDARAKQAKATLDALLDSLT